MENMENDPYFIIGQSRQMLTTLIQIIVRNNPHLFDDAATTLQKVDANSVRRIDQFVVSQGGYTSLAKTKTE